MLDVLYENLNEFRKDITNNLDINVINKKEKALNIMRIINIYKQQIFHIRASGIEAPRD